MARKITPTHVLLNQIELSSSASSVTFSNIPQGYGDLVVVAQRKSISGANSEKFYLNNDTNNNSYLRVQMYGTGSSTGSTSGTNSSTASVNTTWSVVSYSLMDYSQTDKHKTFLIRDDNTGNIVMAGAHRWASTASVSSIEVLIESNSYASGSIFSLYGVYA